MCRVGSGSCFPPVGPQALPAPRLGVIFSMEFGLLWRHTLPVSDHTLVAFLLDKGNLSILMGSGTEKRINAGKMNA